MRMFAADRVPTHTQEKRTLKEIKMETNVGWIKFEAGSGRVYSAGLVSQTRGRRKKRNQKEENIVE